jgi:hypothetical protein
LTYVTSLDIRYAISTDAVLCLSVFALQLKHIPENHPERRCCDVYGVRAFARHQTMVAVRIKKVKWDGRIMVQAVNGIDKDKGE